MTQKKFKQIYVIDDDDIYVFTALRVLENIKFAEKIVVFEDAKKAIDHLLSESDKGNGLPEIIFLDLNMPVWDGWFFLDEISKTELITKIQIIIVTSSNDPEDISRIEEFDFVKGFISKPLNGQIVQSIFE
jgi:CheY-like chemotaxis protein